MVGRLRCFARHFAAQHAPHLSEAQIQQAVYVEVLKQPPHSHVEDLLKLHAVHRSEGAGAGGSAAATEVAVVPSPAVATEAAAAAAPIMTPALLDCAVSLSHPSALPDLVVATGLGMSAVASPVGADTPGRPAATQAQRPSQQQPQPAASASLSMEVATGPAAAGLGGLCLVFRHECS